MKADWKEINRELNKLREMEMKNGAISDSSNSDWLQISRALEQFKANNIIVVVTGLLKAGKSTLVNLLADNANVSPVGYGVDTTLRPALIMLGGPGFEEKSGFEIYMPRERKLKELERQDEEGNEASIHTAIGAFRREAMLNILDHLRLEGVPLQSDIERKICADLQDGDKRLRTVLCDPAGESNKYIPREPLLVVIHVPESENSLLRKAESGKHGIMLLDMPGLDSGNMSEKTAVLYRDLLHESDMVIFLQSSVAPLNEKGISTFREVVGQRDDLTAWIVHNKMITKSWLREDIVDAENDKQVSRTKKHLEQVLIAASSNRNVAPIQVNLGMAHDSRFLTSSELNTDAETLFNKSGFQNFQEKIRENVNESGAAVREKHCRENLTNAIDKKLENVYRELKKTKEGIKHFEALENKLKERSDQLSKWEREDGSPVKILESAKTKEWNRSVLEKSFEDIYYARHYNFVKPRDGESRLLSEVDKEFEEFGKNCANEANDFLEKLDIWSSIRWQISESANASMKELTKKAYNSLFDGKFDAKDMDKYLGHLPEMRKNLGEVNGWHSLTAGEITHADLAEYYEGPRWVLKLFGKHEKKCDYDQKKIEDVRKGYIQGYLREAGRLMDKMDGTIREELKNETVKMLRDILMDALKRVRQDKTNAEQQRTTIADHLQQLESIKEKI